MRILSNPKKKFQIYPDLGCSRHYSITTRIETRHAYGRKLSGKTGNQGEIADQQENKFMSIILL